MTEPLLLTAVRLAHAAEALAALAADGRTAEPPARSVAYVASRHRRSGFKG
jgi:hypothetical protein